MIYGILRRYLAAFDHDRRGVRGIVVIWESSPNGFIYIDEFDSARSIEG